MDSISSAEYTLRSSPVWSLLSLRMVPNLRVLPGKQRVLEVYPSGYHPVLLGYHVLIRATRALLALCRGKAQFKKMIPFFIALGRSLTLLL